MSKFKVGDKVRVLSDPPHFTDDPGIDDEMESYFGDIVTISSYIVDPSWCRIEEDDRNFIWDDRWFEPIQKETVTISFDPSDRAAAHKVVEEAIKAFYAPKDWTDDEISSAKDLMKDMIQEVFMSGGDVGFDDNAFQKNVVVCVVRPDCFSLDESCGRSAPHGKDIYNVWIGKCVALCKALHRPIPDFIRLKNT